MEIHPLIDPYGVHYSSFAGDVYTLDTASITLTAGTLTADTITDGAFSVTGGTITGATNTNWDAAYAHISNDGSDHSFIDQSVVSGASPTFDGTNFTGIPNGALDDTYVNVDGTTDLTGNWTISTNSITLTAGTLKTLNLIVGNIAERLSGTGVTFDDAVHLGTNNIDGTGIFYTTGSGFFGKVGIGTEIYSPDRPLEIRNASPVIRLRATGSYLDAAAPYVEFGGDNAGSWKRTGYVGDAISGDTSIYLRAEVSDLKLGDSTSDSVLTLSSGNVILAGTGEINFRDTDISIGSTLTDGILDMSADVAIDMFFDNADRGAEEDGQHLNINRRAAGDDYISLYVDKDRKGLIGFSGDDDLLQLATGALTVNGSVTAAELTIDNININGSTINCTSGNLTITADGGTIDFDNEAISSGPIAVTQINDADGFKVTGFDDRSGSNLAFFVNASGTLVFDGTGGNLLFSAKTAAKDIYFRTLDSSGDIIMLDNSAGHVKLVGGGGNVEVGSRTATNNSALRHYGNITGGDQYYAQWQVDDTDDYFKLTRSNAGILGFKIIMPVDITGDATISGTGTFGDLLVHDNAGGSTRPLEWVNSGATNNYLKIGDSVHIGLIGGNSNIRAVDGTNDDLWIDAKGTGGVAINWQAGSNGLWVYSGNSNNNLISIIPDAGDGTTTIWNSPGNLIITSAGGTVNFDNENITTTGIGTFGVASIGDGGTTNYLEVSATGDLTLFGSADTIDTIDHDLNIDCGSQKTLKLVEEVYKDINMAGYLLTKPASSAPGTVTFVDENGDDTTIETYGFAVGELVHGGFELQHDYAEGTNLVFHVHWQGIAAPSGTDNVQWRLTYIVMRDGTTLNPAVTIDSPDTSIDAQYESNKTDFAAIDGTGFLIEDQFIFTLTRVAATGDAYAGEALIATAGIHYEVDTLGSRQIATK